MAWAKPMTRDCYNILTEQMTTCQCTCVSLHSANSLVLMYLSIFSACQARSAFCCASAWTAMICSVEFIGLEKKKEMNNNKKKPACTISISFKTKGLAISRSLPGTGQFMMLLDTFNYIISEHQSNAIPLWVKTEE